MTFSQVTPEMVSTLSISDVCIETLPCQHECEIALADGREIQVTLKSTEIDSLIHSIAMDKIECAYPNQHFANHSYCTDPSDILTSIFKASSYSNSTA